MKIATRNSMINATRLLVACTLLYAAISKGMSFFHFTVEMKKSPILEPFNTTWLAIAVLACETVTTLLLCFEKTAKAGLYLSFFIMSLFSGYLLLLYTNYPNAPCSCGGILGSLSYPVHIVFNLALTVLSVLAIVLSERKDS